jgi:TRAP-type C4-dicarboxylate transport system substrate-binding protein
VHQRCVPLLVALLAMLCLAAPAAARTLKIATIVPDGSAWMQEMRRVGKAIEGETQDRVKLKFYPGGIMGNDKTVLRKIRAGQLQGGAFTSGALARIYADIEIYGIPLLLRSYAEVDYVRARMDDALIAGLERAGLVALAITDGGFAYLMSQKPLRRVSDLRGTKLWIQEGDVMSQTAFQIAGGSPIQLPLADVYTALQTRLVDTVAAPTMGAIALQWHTKVKYMTDVPLSYLTGVFALDAKIFRELRAADQHVLREKVGQAARGLDAASREGEQNAKEALRKQGIEFVTAATAKEVERWHDISRQALVLLREKQVYSSEMLDALERHLEDCRSRSRESGGE